MNDEKDLEFSHVVLSSVIDTCKFSEEVLPTVIYRSIFSSKTYLKNVMKCPFRKDHWYRYHNLTVTDELLPPIPYEMKFKFQVQNFGLIQGRKGWILLGDLNVTGKVKKEIFKLN
jgi:hypothetical protein